MIVQSKVRIKYNGKRYNPGDNFKIEEKHYESIKDIVKIIEKSYDNDEDEGDVKTEADLEENDLPFDDLSEENTLHNGIDYNSLTKPEIVETLREKGIEHNSRDKKEVLVELLVGSE